MKAIALALVLSQDWGGPNLYATEPPPETLARMTWRFQDESAPGYFVTREHMHTLDSRQQECQDRLADAQIEAASVSMPRWAWVSLGLAAGLTVGWFTAGVAK